MATALTLACGSCRIDVGEVAFLGFMSSLPRFRLLLWGLQVSVDVIVTRELTAERMFAAAGLAGFRGKWVVEGSGETIILISFGDCRKLQQTLGSLVVFHERTSHTIDYLMSSARAD